jgi:hypothetical protein
MTPHLRTRRSAAAALPLCASLWLAAGAAFGERASGIAGLWATPAFGSIVELRPCAAAPEASR